MRMISHLCHFLSVVQAIVKAVVNNMRMRSRLCSFLSDESIIKGGYSDITSCIAYTAVAPLSQRIDTLQQREAIPILLVLARV